MNKKTRMFSLNHFEELAWKDNKYVCGIDEVGRGCLGGPVFASAVVMPIRTSCFFLIKDSKLLSSKQREEAFEWIKKHCFYSIGIVNPNRIDSINVYQATIFAMKKAFFNLVYSKLFSLNNLKYVLVDAVPLKILGNIGIFSVESFNFGEQISSSIAAASIVAKVKRDYIMKKLGAIFPNYQLEKNKGYGTSDHRTILCNQGESLIHRKSFLSKIVRKEESNKYGQFFLF